MVINLIHSSALTFFFFFLSDKYVQCPIGPGLLMSVLYIRENVLSMLKRLDKNVRFKNLRSICLCLHFYGTPYSWTVCFHQRPVGVR